MVLRLQSHFQVKSDRSLLPEANRDGLTPTFVVHKREQLHFSLACSIAFTSPSSSLRQCAQLMLTVSLLERRVAWPSCTSHRRLTRAFSDSTRCLVTNPGHAARRNHIQPKEAEKGDKEVRKPSLVEQLFPEETKRYEEGQKQKQREIPRLPLDDVQPKVPNFWKPKSSTDGTERLSNRALKLRKVMDNQTKAAESQTSALVLLNANKNLTEEDFRRLIPQGKHLEGWKLEQGNILKIIPGRNLVDLEQTNEYFLLFSSPLSAFVYQGQATRISRLVTEQSPNALHNSIPPPPGYLIDGIDAHAAMQAYALTAPTQKLQLRQLKPPLSPVVAHLVRHGGYGAIVNRSDKMPFEARLTLQGPQIPLARIRHIIYESGRDRALAWSGGEEEMINISRWEPKRSMFYTTDLASGRTDLEQDQGRGRNSKDDHFPPVPDRARRTPQDVYIVGFHTELAAQTFVRYWHRRPMDWKESTSDIEGDSAPVANVSMLW